jgi:citronellyl-CoA synthetase
MTAISKTREFFRVLREAAGIAPAIGYKMAQDDDTVSLGSLYEDTVARYPDNIMLIFEDQQWTYSEFNGEVNQFARALANRGVSRGDTVALFMENRAEYVLSMLALVKLGASASLVNNSLTGAALVHCLQATDARGCIFGEERATVFDEVRGELGWTDGQPILWFANAKGEEAPGWALDARADMAPMATHNLEATREITAGETALYIFTSGTTGLPKAAVVPHRKILAAGHGMGRLGFRIKPEDRLYLCLPIYHITGMGPGFCGFISAGGSIVLRRGFSASKFWPEIQKHQANCFIYVGELCRYLSMQPPCPEEKNNPLQKMLGNGLRPDVWDEFKSRFGVSRILTRTALSALPFPGSHWSGMTTRTTRYCAMKMAVVLKCPSVSRACYWERSPKRHSSMAIRIRQPQIKKLFATYSSKETSGSIPAISSDRLMSVLHWD